MNRKRRWQSAADRARVAADLMAEAESLTDEAALASPAEVEREHLPPPLPLTRPLEAATIAAPTPASPPVAPPPPRPDDPEAALAALDAALGDQPDECTLLVRRAGLRTRPAGTAGRGRPPAGDSRRGGRPRVPRFGCDRPPGHEPARCHDARGPPPREGGRGRLRRPPSSSQGTGNRLRGRDGRRRPARRIRDPCRDPQRD